MGELRDCISLVLSFVLSHGEYYEAESSCVAFCVLINQEKSVLCTCSECENAVRPVLTFREILFATKLALGVQRISLKVLLEIK